MYKEVISNLKAKEVSLDHVEKYVVVYVELTSWRIRSRLRIWS